MKKALSPLLLLSVLALSACSIAQPSAATATAPQLLSLTKTPEPSPSSSATPPPAIEFPVLSLLPDKQAGDWRVVGLIENHSAENLIDAHVLVTLLDAGGDPLSSADIPITFKHLGPDETSPFRAEFPGAGLAADVRAELSSYGTGEYQRLELEVEIVSAASVDRGGAAVLAAITNHGERSASIVALALLAQDSRGRALGLADQIAGAELLRSGETATVLATLEIDPGVSTFSAYVDAVAVELLPDPQPVALDGSANLVFDDQGNPIIVGALRNNSQQSYMGSMTLTLSHEHEWVSASQVETAIPLGPGEVRPFTVVDFPGLAARLQQLGGSLQDLDVEARPAPLIVGSEAEPHSHLDLSILSFDRIGGFAFILGTVTNPYANPVQGATVMATLYSSWGSIVTAGWLTVPEILLPGESHDFVMPIPMPANANPRLSEFDIWAAGVQFSPSPGEPG